MSKTKPNCGTHGAAFPSRAADTGVMRNLALLLLLASALPAQILTINPAVITECTNGLGRATPSWNSPLNAPVQIRVDARDGTPMTGFDPPVFSEPTGDWVRDGMVFYLVNDAGLVIDRVTRGSTAAALPIPATPPSRRPRATSLFSSGTAGSFA